MPSVQWTGPVVLLVLCPGVLCAGCVQVAAPAPAVQRSDPPPWPAPRDAVSYIDAAALPHVRLDARDHQRIVELRVNVDGRPVTVPAGLGVDRIRAVQAPAHTHDGSGRVWLEGEGTEQVTLEKLFTLWGVRFDGTCLGSACGRLNVSADGRPVNDPTKLPLVRVQRDIEVTAFS